MPETARSDPLPAYLRITEMLMRDIASGRLADGQRLAPERDLAPELGVSVGTLRKALAELEERGLLDRRHGSGNYIRHDTRAAAGYSLFRLELRAGGGDPHAEVLDVARLDKPDWLAPLGDHAKATRIRRLRHLSGQPVAVEEIWLDGRFTPSPDPKTDFGALTGSLYRFYADCYRLWILSAEDHVSAGPVPDWAPDGFAPRPGVIAPLITRLAKTQHGEPAEMSRTHFDPARAHYVARLP